MNKTKRSAEAEIQKAPPLVFKQDVHNRQMVKHLFESVRDSKSGFQHVPAMLKKILREECWREQRMSDLDGRVVRFNSVAEWITARPLGGLNTTVELLRKVCEGVGDTEALVMLEQALGNETKAGGDRQSEAAKSIHNNVMNAPAVQGNGRAYAIRKLSTVRPDLLEQVKTGKLSAHAAMLESGLRKKSLQLPLDNLKAVAVKLLQHFDRDELIAALKGTSLE